MFFSERPFSAPGRHLGAQGAGKGTKRSPKVSQKGVRRHLVEHAKTMVFIVREAYREVPGRAREPLFPRRRREGASRDVWRMIWGRFCGIWEPFGGPWGAHFRSKIVFFFRSDFRSILGLFLGGAGVRGGVPGSLQNLQKGARDLTRPAPLRGGGES